MTRPALSLLLAAGLLSALPLAWADGDAVPAAATAAVPSSTDNQGTEAPAASSAAPAEAAPSAATAAPAEVSPAPGAATAANAPAMSTAAAPATAETAPTAASAVSAAPAAAAPAMAMPASPSYQMQLPQRGMDMANVEHIFGAPLEKQPAVGKPPISRWVYADYVVYFEYNMVLHAVMKANAFTQTPGG
ncbi:MAG TPA: hypothetical protein VF651_09830 [Gammaproteobacteria bacterium]